MYVNTKGFNQMAINTATHVIFDLGGTLALDVSARYYGKQYIRHDKNKLRDVDNVPEFLVKICDSLDLKAPLAEFMAMVYKELSANPVELIPGVDQLIRHLYQHNIPMAIATNGSTKIFSSCVGHLMPYFDEYFTHYVCGEDDPDVRHNKPAPDIYQVCAKRFASPPESPHNCVVFEDSLTGITGAVASGMTTVLINDTIDSTFDAIMGKVTAICKNVIYCGPEEQEAAEDILMQFYERFGNGFECPENATILKEKCNEFGTSDNFFKDVMNSMRWIGFLKPELRGIMLESPDIAFYEKMNTFCKLPEDMQITYCKITNAKLNETKQLRDRFLGYLEEVVNQTKINLAHMLISRDYWENVINLHDDLDGFRNFSRSRIEVYPSALTRAETVFGVKAEVKCELGPTYPEPKHKSFTVAIAKIFTKYLDTAI
ncbi:unnamed protein product [Medioppia subpectinata]|uniref:Uncharacterized protein n=1 Tax=Medioppia subpectinata TaxID=1979941 RepID=A0A7R9KIR6_9ACAR|nr:unnamed protein product [Medioppia subpectinata]CAG2104270.1 unnamed protein product [Medioppia subpectinata]